MARAALPQHAMLFSRPASLPVPSAAPARSQAARSPSAARAREQAWRLLVPGDLVSIAGRGSYRIVHLSEARAWVTSLDDGANRLVAAPLLRLHGAIASAPPPRP